MREAEHRQAELTRNVLTAMRSDTRFSSLTTMLDELETLFTNWQQKAAEASNRDAMKVYEKNELRQATMAKMYALAMQVNLMCRGTDGSLALASGLPLREDPQPVTEIEQPVITGIVHTANSGTVELTWTNRRGVNVFALEHSLDNQQSWQNGAYSRATRKRMGGFTPGAIVAFRVKAIGSSVESDWSEPVSILVV